MYFASEDSKATVTDLVKLAGGDVERLWVFDAADGYDPLNIIDHLRELMDEIKQKEVRLVIFDALNSFAKGNQGSDADARVSLSGPLARLARRTGACVIGVRNQGRSQIGKGSDRALGAISLSHVSRCDAYTKVDPQLPSLFWLEFEKVTDAKTPKPMLFLVHDCSKGKKEDSHLRRIEWNPGENLLDLLRKKVAKKSSKPLRKA